MSEFFAALGEYRFLQYAVMAGVLASVACGIVGSYVVTRRISYVAGAMAHFILGGLGAARYLQIVHGWQWLEPLYGAIIAALTAAFIIGLVIIKGNQREDTVIGALWAIGMAAGILFISQTPGYNEDLMSYLFGNILMVTSYDIWFIGILDLSILIIVSLFYRQLQAVCFDEEFARLRGINVELFFLMLLFLTAMTVVLLVTVVGIILVIALITLPAAIAGHFTNSLGRMMLLASLFSIAFTIIGLGVSYDSNLPAGATIIVIAGAVYMVMVVIGKFRKSRA